MKYGSLFQYENECLLLQIISETIQLRIHLYPHSSVEFPCGITSFDPLNTEDPTNEHDIFILMCSDRRNWKKSFFNLWSSNSLPSILPNISFIAKDKTLDAKLQTNIDAKELLKLNDLFQKVKESTQEVIRVQEKFEKLKSKHLLEQ